MSLAIEASSLTERRVLAILDDGVSFVQSGVVTTRKRFGFGEIECVLLSASHLLSFQVGAQVYGIQTKPDKPQHQEVITALLDGVARTSSGIS